MSALADISRHVWETRYRHRNGDVVHDATLRDTWVRVARALAAVEADPGRWEREFLGALADFRFLPGGRILAGAGTGRKVTLFNCYVMGVIPDRMDGIFDALKEGALTMQQGGGVGWDFSTLRPRGEPSWSVGTVASGPVSFLHIWDAACATVLSTGARRGAMMATLRCDHPDIEAFVAAKAEPGALRHFNLSVLVSDALMEAVRDDRDWPLVFPDPAGTVARRWTGAETEVPCRIHRTVRARELWASILQNTYEHAEPGVLFVDRINAENNLWWREPITATNPCGEIPLQPYGACDLGSLNLVAFVRDGRLDVDAVVARVPTAVRLLDDVIDASEHPLPAQAEQARGTRRTGLGITGLGDALALIGLPYGSPEARAMAADLMRSIRDAAYRASVALAEEKGAFPFYDPRYLDGAFAQRLPEELREGIRRHGIRNSHLLAIAPAGTISLLANNVSSGIEPIFAHRYAREVTGLDGRRVTHVLEDEAVRRWRAEHGGEPLPASFATATELSPEAHLLMQAAVQPFVDNAVSKTINVPRELPFSDFAEVYDRAYALGLKGCTTYRPSEGRGHVLVEVEGTCGLGECE